MTTLLDEDQNTKAKLLLLVEVGCSQRARQFPVVLLLSVQHERTFHYEHKNLSKWVSSINLKFGCLTCNTEIIPFHNLFYFKFWKSAKLPSVVVWHLKYTFLVSASITNLWQQLNSSCINTVTRHVECSSLTLHICNLIRCFQFVQNR